MKRRIRKVAVLNKVGYSAATLNQRIADGDFPAPTYERNIPYWLESEVDTFIDRFFSADQDSHPIAASL
jgi:predicted DNA-binding transcriptional regulator AlpA